MRISDWSSDVCSSDLERDARQAELADHGVGIVDRVAAPERDLHVLPLHAGVVARAPHRVGGNVDGRLPGEAPERVEIGSGSGRGRVGTDVWVSVGAVSLQNKN